MRYSYSTMGDIIHQCMKQTSRPSIRPTHSLYMTAWLRHPITTTTTTTTTVPSGFRYYSNGSCKSHLMLLSRNRSPQLQQHKQWRPLIRTQQYHHQHATGIHKPMSYMSLTGNKNLLLRYPNNTGTTTGGRTVVAGIHWFRRPHHHHYHRTYTMLTPRWNPPPMSVTTTVSSQTTLGSTRTTTTTATVCSSRSKNHHNPPTSTTNVHDHNPYRPIGQYVSVVAGMVIAMISIGGITRLTQSGLSMTSWTLTGSIPPWTSEEWQQEFQIYQQYPEYQQRTSMTLSDFQYIYFWEYGHRMMGRLIGMVYILPYVYFSMTRQIPKGYHPRFVLIGSIGLLQGFVGWWMVQSGLTQDRFQDTHEIRVKPLRLTTHLFMAITTYSLLLYTALDMYRYPMIVHPSSTTSAVAATSLPPHQQHMKDMLRILSRSSIGMIALTLITILSGALVAGNDAGRAYNTFPKMNDEWFPSNYFGEPQSRSSDEDDSNDSDQNGTDAPLTTTTSTTNGMSVFKNFYENTATVQFNHRFCGMTTALSGISLSLYGLYRIYPSILSSSIGSSSTTISTATPGSILKVNPSLLLPSVRTGLLAIGMAVTGQFTLGVTTLMMYVPISLAALHQIGSIVVLTSSIYLLHTTRTILKALPTATKTISTTIASTAATTNSVLTNPALVRQLSTLCPKNHNAKGAKYQPPMG